MITTSISPRRTSTRACSAAITLFDDKDTGDETTGLRLPSGDYDVPIFFNDFLFDPNCQQVFDLFDLDGILGDRFCANGAIQPYFERQQAPLSLPAIQSRPVALVRVRAVGRHQLLPVLADLQRRQPAAAGDPDHQRAARRGRAGRYHRRLQQGQASRLYLVNRLEQVNGRGPTGNILTPGTPIVQINIGAAAPDYSVDPAAAPLVMRTLPDPDFNALLARAAKAHDPHLAVRTRQRRLDGQRQVLRRERGQCRHPAANRRKSGSSRTPAAAGVTLCTSTSKSTACCRATARW